MASARNTSIYLALRTEKDRSSIEDSLVLDDFNVTSFRSAEELWEAFQARPARFVITERRFPGTFAGLELTQNIRHHHYLPYVYVLMLSVLSRFAEIQEGLIAGVDDYLIKPLNPTQIRARVLVGMRWLTYIDSVTAAKVA
jgi:DNA-binding response OmpR family regulator